MRFMLGFLGALGLGLLATVIILVLRDMGSNLNKVSTAQSEVSTISTNVPGDVGGVAGVSSISTAMVARDSDAPSNMVTGTALVDPWGGQVTVTPANNPGQYDVALQGVPGSACSKLVNGVGQFKGVTINGSALSMPVDPATVSQDCQSSSNSVTFDFVG